MPEETKRELLALVPDQFHTDIEFRSVSDDLPSVLADATITVLPSLWEAFGMLVIESFAAGTPVVATRQGALPEHFVYPELGCLFDPGEDAEEKATVTNIEGLAEAIRNGLDLARSPRTAAVCRRFAESYCWSVVGAKYEDLITRQLEPLKECDGVGAGR